MLESRSDRPIELSKTQQKLQVFFTKIDNHTKYAWAIPLDDKSRKSTTTALKNLLKKQNEGIIKFGQVEVKDFTVKHF